jgi:hypothetical protein
MEPRTDFFLATKYFEVSFPAEFSAGPEGNNMRCPDSAVDSLDYSSELDAIGGKQ